jgi:hypothetical protein
LVWWIKSNAKSKAARRQVVKLQLERCINYFLK